MLLPQNLIPKWRIIAKIICQLIMSFRNIKIHWYEWVGGGIKLDILCYLSTGKLLIQLYKKLWRILHTIMLVPLPFSNGFVSFPLFWVVTSIYYYYSTKDKYPILYVSSSCYLTMEHIATIQQYHHRHIMLAFSLLYSIIKRWTFAKIYVSLSWLYSTVTLSSFPIFML